MVATQMNCRDHCALFASFCFTLSIRLYRLNHHHHPTLEDVKTTLVSLISYYKASNELISLSINTRPEGLFCIIFYPVIFETVCNLTAAATADCAVLLWRT